MTKDEKKQKRTNSLFYAFTGVANSIGIGIYATCDSALILGAVSAVLIVTGVYDAHKANSDLVDGNFTDGPS